MICSSSQAQPRGVLNDSREERNVVEEIPAGVFGEVFSDLDLAGLRVTESVPSRFDLFGEKRHLAGVVVGEID